MTWRGTWAIAQITAIAASSMVWLILSALRPSIVGLLWLFGAVLVVTWPTGPAFRWRCGGRRVSASDRLMVLRAVAPVQRLRGRNQPEVLVSRRPGIDLAVGPRCLIVSHSLLNGLRSHRVTNHRFATVAARSVGTSAVTKSRMVAAVELYCLPWSLMERFVHSVVGHVPQMVRGRGVARWIPWLVLTLAVVELSRRGLWVSLAMVVLVGLAMVTTGRCNRAWAVRLEQLAQAEVSRCGLAAQQPEDPDPWAFLFDEDHRRRDREVWS